jgi:hypothetical protein
MIFVGVTPKRDEVFKCDFIPNFYTHENKYNVIIGPFRTLMGAKFMVHFGRGNPHCRTVSEAEKVGLMYKDDLKSLLLFKDYS